MSASQKAVSASQEAASAWQEAVSAWQEAASVWRRAWQEAALVWYLGQGGVAGRRRRCCCWRRVWRCRRCHNRCGCSRRSSCSRRSGGRCSCRSGGRRWRWRGRRRRRRGRRRCRCDRRRSRCGRSWRRCSRRRCGRSRRRRWRRCRCSIRRRALNPNGDWRPCLEETDRRVHSLRRTIGIETEVIQRAPANGVGVLVLRKSLRAPAQSAGGLILRPGSVAKSRAGLCSIIGNSRMLRRRMKPDIADRDSASQRHTERLDPAIEILIIDRVLIMPHARDRAGHFVGNKPLAIDSGLGLERTNRRSSPGVDGRGRAHGGCPRSER